MVLFRRKWTAAKMKLIMIKLLSSTLLYLANKAGYGITQYALIFTVYNQVHCIYIYIYIYMIKIYMYAYLLMYCHVHIYGHHVFVQKISKYINFIIVCKHSYSFTNTVCGVWMGVDVGVWMLVHVRTHIHSYEYE